MADRTDGRTKTTWELLRESTGLSQRAVERSLGWKRGHLSLIERGMAPTPEQATELRRFYVEGKDSDA